MARKIYYDATANKEVVDVSGVKDEAAVKAEFGLGGATQVVEIDESFEATEVVAGTLQKFDQVARLEAAAIAAAASKLGKQNSIRAKLGLTPTEFEDLREALL